MASIHREVLIEVSPDTLWDALKDVGALHTRLVRGFVTDCRLEGNAVGGRGLGVSGGLPKHLMTTDAAGANRT